MNRPIKAAFLDRDGTINVKRDDYVKSPGELVIIEDAVAGMRKLQDKGYALVVVTNQSAVGRGIITEAELDGIHARMERKLAESDVRLAGVYFCPHLPGDGCRCRKPRTGMIDDAAYDLNIDTSSSYMIGDSASDAEAGLSAGLGVIKINTDGGFSGAVDRV